MEAEVTMYDAQVKKLQGLCDEHDLVFKLEKEQYPIQLTISQVQKQYEQGTLMPDDTSAQSLRTVRSLSPMFYRQKSKTSS